MKTSPLAKLRLVVAWIIVGAWVLAFVLDIALPTYDVPATVHGLMAMVAAFLFGPAITGRGKETPHDSDIDR